MIVRMSRQICVDLYGELACLSPIGTTRMTTRAVSKVVMTGSASDPTDGQPHIRNKAPREALATRVRDTDDPLQVVLVHDMAHRVRRAEPAHDGGLLPEPANRPREPGSHCGLRSTASPLSSAPRRNYG